MAFTQINFDFEDEAPAPYNIKKKSVTPPKEKQKRGRKPLKDEAPTPYEVNVPEDEVLFEKQYYSIGDVALMFNENISLIRYWEKEFTVLKPKKNKKGDRLFRPADIKNLKMIHYLIRERKYTIEGVRELLKSNKGSLDQHELIESLNKVKSFLLELKNNL
ncbi:MAG: MerR family transcriptional regulator [Ginsengibacter sp.]